MVQYERFQMLPLSDFHEELRFEFPNLPAQLFDYYIIKTAIKMAEDGNLLRRRIKFNVQPGVPNYTIDLPSGLVVSGILDANHGHCDNRPMHRGTMRHPCSRENIWFDDIEKEIHFDNIDGPIWVLISVAPTKDTCELPIEYRDNYLETLVTGARAYIMMITGRPWSNLQLGAALEQRFKQMLSNDAIELMTHKQRGAIHMNFGRAL